MTVKKCSACHEEKDESEFHKRTASPDGLHYMCKACASMWQKDKNKKNSSKKAYERAVKADAHKESSLRRHYNMSLHEFEILLEKQSSACAICGRSPDGFQRSFAVDHDHVTGVVRGILCPDCNRGLGGFHDDPGILRKAVDYLLTKIEPE